MEWGRRGGGERNIVFGADPVGVGVDVGIGVSVGDGFGVIFLSAQYLVNKW